MNNIRLGQRGVMRGTWLAAAAVLLCGAGAWAQDGITVQGVGQGKGKATQMEISGTITGDAELAADATVKYRDAKKRAIAMLDGLKNPNVSIEFSGFSISGATDANTQQMINQGRMVGAPKLHVQISENCTIIIKEADKLTAEAAMDTLLKVVDVAKDSGIQIGQGSGNSNNYYENQARAALGNAMVTFRLKETNALRDQAYKEALDDAKAKAQKLADLSGIKLGRITGIQEAGEKSGSSSNNYADNALAMIMSRMSSGEDKGILGGSYGDMSMRLSLIVQFEIAK